jgi:hypothetical protein
LFYHPSWSSHPQFHQSDGAVFVRPQPLFATFNLFFIKLTKRDHKIVLVPVRTCRSVVITARTYCSVKGTVSFGRKTGLQRYCVFSIKGDYGSRTDRISTDDGIRSFNVDNGTGGKRRGNGGVGRTNTNLHGALNGRTASDTAGSTVRGGLGRHLDYAVADLAGRPNDTSHTPLRK